MSRSRAPQDFGPSAWSPEKKWKPYTGIPGTYARKGVRYLLRGTFYGEPRAGTERNEDGIWRRKASTRVKGFDTIRRESTHDVS
jgi:hypothetical protein